MAAYEEKTDEKTTKVKSEEPKPYEDIELGVNLNAPFGTSFRDSWELMRSEDISLQQLNTMRKTNGQARALFRLITMTIRVALKTATFVPETNTEGGEDEAKFIEQMLTLPASSGGMETPLRLVVDQMMNGIFDGFSAFEQVYWHPDKGPLKGKWTLKKIAVRPPETITFLLDDHGDFAGLRQRANFQGRYIDVKLEPENCVYYTCQQAERLYYGRSMFLAAYYHYDKIVKLEYIAHIAAQRAALGTRIGKVPDNNVTSIMHIKFKQALADLGFAQHIMVPKDYEVEILKEGEAFPFLDYLNYHNSQMSKSVLASFFDEHQGGGDTAFVDFGQQTDAFFLTMLNTIMDDIADVINNQIIPKFIKWNFNSDKYPKFQFGQLDEKEKNILIDLFSKLATAGQTLTCSPQFVLEMEKQTAELLKLEIDYELVEKEQEEARQQSEMLQQAQITAIEAKGAQAVTDSSGQPAAASAGKPVAGKPKEPAGKPGPNKDSSRTSKPANPASPKPTGKKKVGLTNTEEEDLFTLASEVLEGIRLAALDEE